MRLGFLAAAAAAATAQAMLDCRKMRVDDHTFDLGALGGPHSVVTSQVDSITGFHENRTYTLDICGTLKKSGEAKKTEECPNGTRVCAIKHVIGPDSDQITQVIPIAGALENHGGSRFEYEIIRLRTSDSHADSRKEGVRLVLKGGRHEGREQRAVVEFLCARNRTGLEGEWDAEDRYEWRRRRRDQDRDQDKDKQDGDGGDGGDEVEHQLKKDDDAALIWESYGAEKDTDILRLTWSTKYACEKRDDDKDIPDPDETSPRSHSWGFFTWLFIIIFLGAATYLIFASWLNYTRYGARGWDLVPHADSIRDIPYLVKDWVRRALNTVQGAGSRGGYSAV